ncbi:hypothetical protein [Streptomyces sp. NPDC001380]|uniref:hypothetical protein n=1 Tax=Streptomyces sp. NPDC001380 TaxID=3364566 RepID=UPI0036A6BF23
MNRVTDAEVAAAAAGAALAVPGVVGLQPRVADLLSRAAARFAGQVAAQVTDQAAARSADRAADRAGGSGAGRVPDGAGVRAERQGGGAGWQVEVRCVLDGGTRALDAARAVRAAVLAAVADLLAARGEPEPVSVGVTVTRVGLPVPAGEAAGRGRAGGPERSPQPQD